MGSSYSRLLADLMTFDPPVHVFGGFAEDALLYGRVERPHNDVDVLVGRHEIDHQSENARRIGFPILSIRFEPEPERPLVLGVVHDGLDLEISVYDLADDGIVYFVIPDDAGTVRRVELSAGVFAHPPTSFEGLSLRTVSPLALYQIRAGVMLTGAFGPPRPKDVQAQEALRRHFFPDDDPADLLPIVR